MDEDRIRKLAFVVGNPQQQPLGTLSARAAGYVFAGEDIEAEPLEDVSRWAASEAGDELIQEYKGKLDARKAAIGLIAVEQSLIMAGSNLTDLWPLRCLLRAVAEFVDPSYLSPRDDRDAELDD